MVMYHPEEKEEIAFEGQYWWGDQHKAEAAIWEAIRVVMHKTRVSSIEIYGCDFQDGRERHSHKINVGDGKVILTLHKAERKNKL